METSIPEPTTILIGLLIMVAAFLIQLTTIKDQEKTQGKEKDENGNRQ